MEFGALDDTFAQLEITKLVEKFKIKRIVETGTYLGWSTKFLKGFGLRLDTIEINKNYYF